MVINNLNLCILSTIYPTQAFQDCTNQTTGRAAPTGRPFYGDETSFIYPHHVPPLIMLVKSVLGYTPPPPPPSKKFEKAMQDVKVLLQNPILFFNIFYSHYFLQEIEVEDVYYFPLVFNLGNTISNVVFIIPPLLTVYRTHRSKLLECRFILSLLLLSGESINLSSCHHVFMSSCHVLVCPLQDGLASLELGNPIYPRNIK